MHMRSTLFTAGLLGAFALAGCSSSGPDGNADLDNAGVDPVCNQMYEMLTSDVLGSRTIPQEQVADWATSAKASAAAAREGDSTEARRICQEVVNEMTDAGVSTE